MSRLPGGLTTKQHAFAVEYVRNGGNGTAAARVAGYKGSDKALSVAATRTLGIASVSSFVDSMRGKAIARAEAKGVASLEEALSTASTIMRAKLGDFIDEAGRTDLEALRAAPAGVVRTYSVDSRVERDPSGGTFKEVEKVKFSVGDQLAAAQSLIRHYDGVDAPAPPAVVNILAILGGLSKDTLKELREAFKPQEPDAS